MATVKLTNYIPAVPTRDEHPRLLALAHILAYREASTTLSSELLTQRVSGKRWMDVSDIDDDLPLEVITDSLEYLGLRGLLELNQSHPTLFRVKKA